MRRSRPDRSRGRRRPRSHAPRSRPRAAARRRPRAARSSSSSPAGRSSTPRASARARSRPRSAGSARASSTRRRWPRTRSTARSGRGRRGCRGRAGERRTLVAMSGGVDSAVAAQLAAERGDDVVAVTLELWADPAVDTTRSCCSSQAVATARALAHGMGIPHLTLDLREPFGERVVADFVAEHRAGRTPNPCVRCNGMLRFDAMLDLADRHRRRAARDRPLRAHRARPRRRRARAGPRQDEGPDVHARGAAGGPARPHLVPARRSDEARGQAARPRRGPAGGRQAREPGPLLPRRGRRHARHSCAGTHPTSSRPTAAVRSSTRMAASSAATPASATSRSASGAASASRARSRSTSLGQGRPQRARPRGAAPGAPRDPGHRARRRPCTGRRPRWTA